MMAAGLYFWQFLWGQFRWVSVQVRKSGGRWTCAAVVLFAAGLSWLEALGAADQQARPTAASSAEPESAPEQANLRVREGTEIVGEFGYFRMTGGRVVFFTGDGKRRFVGLENLHLERISRAVAESRHSLRWDVTGTITEYRGANFLLVRRAILKSGPQSPGGRF